jgi:hypothetical protein
MGASAAAHEGDELDLVVGLEFVRFMFTARD